VEIAEGLAAAAAIVEEGSSLAIGRGAEKGVDEIELDFFGRGMREALGFEDGFVDTSCDGGTSGGDLREVDEDDELEDADEPDESAGVTGSGSGECFGIGGSTGSAFGRTGTGGGGEEARGSLGNGLTTFLVLGFGKLLGSGIDIVSGARGAGISVVSGAALILGCPRSATPKLSGNTTIFGDEKGTSPGIRKRS